MTSLQAKSFDPADKIDQLAFSISGDILVPNRPSVDIDSLTMEDIGSALRREELGEDISNGVVYTDNWKYKDRRVGNHNNVFLSYFSDDGEAVVHRQLQGDPADAIFIFEDLRRACAGGEVRYRPEPNAFNELVADNDNKPSQPASTKPKLTADEELEYLQTFQREQLLPGERGDLVFECAAFRDGKFWHIRNAIIEGFAGNVFIGAEDGAPKFHADGIVEPITLCAPFPLVDPSDWHGTVAKAREWFLTGLIPHRQVTLLSGDGGMGKSLLGLQIGAASALAIKTLGLQPRPGRVLYLGAEDEAEEFHRRLDDICAAHGHEIGDLADLRILPLADQDAILSEPDPKGNMKATPLWKRVDRFVEEWKPGLVVLDTAADLYGGDEIKRSQVRHFVGMLRKMAIGHKCAVLLLAHPSVAGMTSGSGYSGSTAWNNSVRSRLYLTSGEGDARVLKTVKSNYGKKGGEIHLEWRDGVFVTHDPSEPTIADGLIASHDDKKFLAILSKLNRNGMRPSPNRSPSYAPKLILRHPDGKGTKAHAMEQAMHRLLDAGKIKVVQEGPPSRRYARLIVSAEDFGGVDNGADGGEDNE